MISDSVQRSMLETEVPASPLRVLAQNDNQGLDPFARVRGRYPRYLKPVVDRVGGAALLLLASPFMAAVALTVAVGVGRPIIFRQVRVGQNGRLFTVYKFCTMTADRRCQDVAPAGEDRRVSHKRDDDPRLRPVGRVLRRWSLDELPQLWNVVRGDMSLVGPRPELPFIVDRFAPWQHDRHIVKPGLTGFWQVYARGDGHVMHQRTELDIAYVGRISLLTDLKILVLTLPAIVGLKKGY